MSSNKRLRLSDPSSETPGASTSSSSVQKKSFKYDVFLSFRGKDTRKTFVAHLYEALKQKGIETYMDDKKMEQGEMISDQLIESIQESRFFIIVLSKTYASSSWCLQELVKIMECQKMDARRVYPVFFDVEPTEVRKQIGAVKEAFAEHEKKEAAGKWREAMKEASDLAGWELKLIANGDESILIQKIVAVIFERLCSINSGGDGHLVGMEMRMKDILSSLENGAEVVRMIGIKGIGGGGKTTLARAVYDQISTNFEGISFVENVREVSTNPMFGLKKMQEQILRDVFNDNCISINGVSDGKNMMIQMMSRKKVLLVLDDVDHIDQLEALAGNPSWFKLGSIIIITTRDEHVLLAHKVNVIHDVNLLSHKEAICLFSQYAFGKEDPIQACAELSEQVASYAAGLPLTLKVLGSFLCDKNEHEWKDALDRLRTIPLKETLEILKISYIGLEDDYKEIFLDVACILKGNRIEYAIRVLDSCGFYARNGLKVLEQRSLITISKDHVLGMHDSIEEMGKDIVRSSHPDEPNKHSRLWIDEETEYILANDMGTEATRCLKLNASRGNSGIVVKGLANMKKLRYLEVKFDFSAYYSESDAECFDDTSQYFTNSLKYLNCSNYPFLYLPKSFKANNLVGLYVSSSRMVQLLEEGEKKILEKLKFILLSHSNLTTFDFSITPNLETLSLIISSKLKELCMPTSCQKLKFLEIVDSQLITFDLGLTPNLETLSLPECTQFEELHVSVPCPNLKFLDLSNSRLRCLDLELIPNLETLVLAYSKELVEINAPVGCLRKVVELDLRGCVLLEKLPEDLGGYLKELDISETGIRHLPQSIFGLKGLLITASSKLLQLYDFPSEIKTTTRDCGDGSTDSDADYSDTDSV